MQIEYNGETVDISDSLSLLDFIEEQGLDPQTLAAAVDERIITKDKWHEFKLSAGMRLELFSMVGGG